MHTKVGLNHLYSVLYTKITLYFRLLGEWPNTYTFTKSLAECLVKDISNGIPVGIFRPGIGELLSTSPKFELIFFLN